MTEREKETKEQAPNEGVASPSPEHWLSAALLDRHGQKYATPDYEPALSKSLLHTHDGPIGATTELEGRTVVSFSTANYLGLAAHPDVIAAAQSALSRYGTSMCVGRVSDQTRLQLDLERALAVHVGAPAACIVASGYVANLAVLGHLFGPRDLIVHDRHAHASVLEGWRLSHARRHSFPHNDFDALAAVLAKVRKRARRAVVVVEGLYSVDGDIPDLPRLVRIAQAEDCLVAVDESHSLGVLGATGAGLAEHWNLAGRAIDLRTGSLGKSLAANAGFFSGGDAVVRELQLEAPTVALSTGAGVASMAIAMASLALLRREPERVTRLRGASRAFRAAAASLGLSPQGAEDSPIVTFAVGDEGSALRLGRRLLDAGIVAAPFIFPAVARGQACLRFMITAEHSLEQVSRAAEVMARSL